MQRSFVGVPKYFAPDYSPLSVRDSHLHSALRNVWEWNPMRLNTIKVTSLHPLPSLVLETFLKCLKFGRDAQEGRVLRRNSQHWYLEVVNNKAFCVTFWPECSLFHFLTALSFQKEIRSDKPPSLKGNLVEWLPVSSRENVLCVVCLNGGQRLVRFRNWPSDDDAVPLLCGI